MVLAGVALAGFARRPILVGAGRLLVAEDPLAPVDAIVISSANWDGGALEAAQLFHAGFGAEILLMAEPDDPVDVAIRQLGIVRPRSIDMAEAILERSGVPADVIQVIPIAVDGTDMEVAALSSFVQQQHVPRVLFITARTHTRRARWLLRRKLPPATRAIVRSSRLDSFPPAAWWLTRGYSREVAMEYLRWLNTMMLHDLWSESSATHGTTSDDHVPSLD